MPAGDDAPRTARLSRRAALVGLAALAGGACSRVEFLAANLPAIAGPFTRRADIPYGTDPRQRLDLYTPDGARNLACPVIVFWHGGRWEYGDKGDYRFVGAALAELGYIAVLPNYRHYPQVRMPGFLQDAARAAAWAAAHASGHPDPRQFFLMGHSAGAHLAALVALDTRHYAAAGVAAPSVAGVIGLSGPYDFLPLLEDDLRDMFGPPELYPESQPINFVHAGAPPMLLVHGERDRTVAPKNTRNLAAALLARGVEVRVRLYPKLRHADTVAAISKAARWRAPVLADVAAFVDHIADAPRGPAATARVAEGTGSCGIG